MIYKIADLDHEAHAFLSSLNAEFVQHKLNLDYEYWSAGICVLCWICQDLI